MLQLQKCCQSFCLQEFYQKRSQFVGLSSRLYKYCICYFQIFVLMNSLNAVTNDSKALIANSTLQIDATPSQVLANALYRIQCIPVSHMGQFLQGGKNGCFVSLFLFTESLCVAKPCKIKQIFRLILVDWVLCIVKTS